MLLMLFNIILDDYGVLYISIQITRIKNWEIPLETLAN